MSEKKRKKLKHPSDQYVLAAKALSKQEAERLMSRMRGKFVRRWTDRKLTRVEILALQLEFEEEELKEWRKNVAKLRERKK
jgi:hypothetical protein